MLKMFEGLDEVLPTDIEGMIRRNKAQDADYIRVSQRDTILRCYVYYKYLQGFVFFLKCIRHTHFKHDLYFIGFF